MFVRRLVTGVRSSCEASATSWRWARTDSSSALRERCSRSSIWLKRLASRPTSSSVWTLMRVERSSVSAICCAVRSTCLSGLSTRRLAIRPSVPATITPPISTNSRTRRRLERMLSTAVQRSGELHRGGFDRPVDSDHDGHVEHDHPQVVAAFLDVGDIHLGLALGDRKRRAVNRQRDVPEPIADMPVVEHHLLVLRGAAGAGRNRRQLRVETQLVALDRLFLGAQGVVDLTLQLVADDQVTDRRCEPGSRSRPMRRR